MEKYDGVIFGNGMTINLLIQLKRLFPKDKLYLLSLDDFMKAFYKSKLSPAEDNRVFSIYYKREDISSLQNYQRMKREFENYYELHDGNIEYHFGSDLFCDKFEYNYPLMKSLFPAFYNIWFEILFDYIEDIGLGGYVSNFYSSFLKIINTSNIWTTNFDRFADKVIKVGHVHGSFVTKLKDFKEVIYYFKDKNNFYFKCIWGWNGLGKYTTIQEYIKRKDYQDYFDFSIFISDVINIKNLLLYGVGFQKSGFIADLAEKYPEYKRPIIGGVIDEHILLRIKALQDMSKIDRITWCYYYDYEAEYYKELCELIKLTNVKFKKSTDLCFSIDDDRWNYSNGK